MEYQEIFETADSEEVQVGDMRGRIHNISNGKNDQRAFRPTWAYLMAVAPTGWVLAAVGYGIINIKETQV
jgi:hypothetical protein